MVSCWVCLVVLMPLLAVGVFYSIQPVEVVFGAEANIRASLEKTFNYVKNPEIIKELVPNVVDVKILRHLPTFLDEKDGLLKEFYEVTVVQDFPHRSGMEFNFTRKVSTKSKTVESQGEVMGFLQFITLYSMNLNEDGTVFLKEESQVMLPRALSWLLIGDLKNNHQSLVRRIKEELEKGEKVDQGTQTD